MKTNLTKDSIDKITKDKMTFNEMCSFLNVSHPTGIKICKKYDIKCKSPDQRTYKPNDDYFKIWSNEMAYFLGLIVADGHIRQQNSCLSISLHEKDTQSVENLRTALNYPGKLYKMNKKDGAPQCCLSVVSKEIASDLHKLGLTGNKTYDFDWITDMPEKYVHHFVRGIFCGDGCIHINEIKGNFQVNIVGTRKLTENIKNYYNAIFKNTDGHISANKNVQTLYFGGRYNALRFLNWIYQDSTPSTRMERKYELYLKLKDTICKEEQTPNNSKINQVIADEIRIKHSTKSVKQLAEEFGLGESLIYDVVQNKSWVDSGYKYTKTKSDTIYITYESKTLTIKEWSQIKGIPATTIDRRYRQGLSIDQVLCENELPKVKVNQSDKDKLAYERARVVREDYKSGIIGKANFEKHGIKKSCYIDLIGNRTCKENMIWWKK